MLKNCTESTECSLPWWPVSSLGEIPRGHLSDGIHTHALVTNYREQGLDKLTNPHSFEKMIESVRCEMYHALAFGSYSAALTGYFLVVTRRMPLFVQPKVMSWNWKFSNSGPAALNLLRTEDGDNSDETKTRLPHRAECVGWNRIAPVRQINVSCEELRSRAFLSEIM